VLRTDASDDAKARALSQFLEIGPLPLLQANVTTTKPERKAYQRFRELLRVTTDYLDHMLDSRFSRYFFDARTLDGLRARYANSGSITPSALTGTGPRVHSTPW
jgi:hypothetical protein